MINIPAAAAAAVIVVIAILNAMGNNRVPYIFLITVIIVYIFYIILHRSREAYHFINKAKHFVVIIIMVSVSNYTMHFGNMTL